MCATSILMFVIIQSLCGPAMMGAGKGGKGGKGGNKKFNIKDMIQGNYSVEISRNSIKEDLQWKGTFVTKNGTTEAPLNQIRIVAGENNTNVTEIVQTKQVAIESENATHLRIKVEGEVVLEGEVALNDKENVYKFVADNETHTIKYTIFNGLYSVISIIEKQTKDVIEFALTKERVQTKSPMWMKLLQPLALLANFWFTRKMKAKQAKNVPQVPQPEEKKEEETKDNEGEEKKEDEKQEQNIKDDKKND